MKIDLMNLMAASKDDEEIQMSSMIDIVFLLLIYFIVTTSLAKSEADLGIQLPGTVVQTTTLKMPDEQIIEVAADGSVILNGMAFDSVTSRDMPELVATLVRFRQASDATKNPAMISIQADEEVVHQRVVDVMNACATAEIKNVTFGMGEE
ncbi:MAG: biopolymer transporter ExbD [Terrimicrobiaceae bacterium]